MEPTPEQTASILSLMLFSVMDPVIVAAWRTTHLSLEDFPRMADYDSIEILVRRSYPVSHHDT